MREAITLIDATLKDNLYVKVGIGQEKEEALITQISYLSFAPENSYIVQVQQGTLEKKAFVYCIVKTHLQYPDSDLIKYC